MDDGDGRHDLRHDIQKTAADKKLTDEVLDAKGG
jgi:hypothetical protein